MILYLILIGILLSSIALVAILANRMDKMSKDLDVLNEEIAILEKFNEISSSNISPSDAYSGLRPKSNEPMSNLPRPLKSSD